jgi:hypothetical protein
MKVIVFGDFGDFGSSADVLADFLIAELKICALLRWLA